MTEVVIPNSQPRPHEGLSLLTNVMYGLHTISWFTLVHNTYG